MIAPARTPVVSPTTAQSRAGDSARDLPPGGTRLRIGDLAAAADVSVDTLRYYERRGLLHPIGRRASGYREFAPGAIGLVRFIKQAQALGFTLAEVEELVRLRDKASVPAAALDVRNVAAAKITDIDERVRQLTALRGALADLVDACERQCGTSGPPGIERCPIIAALNDEPSDGATDASP